MREDRERKAEVVMEFRVETDSLGTVEVPKDRYWGAQTQRAVQNFPIGGTRMPIEVIRALALIKQAAAVVNADLGLLERTKAEAIVLAAEEVMEGRWDDHFPLVVWQTGSGTQSNMNVNEVLANRAIERMGGVIGSKEPVHPNDDVNRGQSSNDVFPSAMHIAAAQAIHDQLLPALKDLSTELTAKATAFDPIVKVGRTHMMDAVELTLGQEFGGYAAQVRAAVKAIETALPGLYELALGGTAVGTGLNTHPEFGARAAARIAHWTGLPFREAPNKFAALAGQEALIVVSGAIRTAAAALFKIANDIRLLASGPRCGLGELQLPANEPGSSIMPGKVNPTQCEALTMVCLQVIANDLALTLGSMNGHLELNVFRPLIAKNVLESVGLLTDAAASFQNRCLKDLKPDLDRIGHFRERSLMMVTALTPLIGYDQAALVAKKALADNTSLQQAAASLGIDLPRGE